MKLASIRPTLEDEWGIHLAQDAELLPREFRRNYNLALDAQPTLLTAANAGVPGWLTAYVDPEVIRILQTPNKGAEIFGEVKQGDWTTDTATFMVVENTGEVAPYGDWNNNGRSDANVNWINRQSYLFQTTISYGDLQVDRAGVARLNWVGELQTSAALTLDKFSDYTYHFGVAGMALYGSLNDPNLPAALPPSTKAAGGTKWVNNGVIVATANEIFNDLTTLVMDLVTRTSGIIQKTDAMKLVLPPQSDVGLMATNQFGISVMDLLQKNFPNLKIVTDPRHATASGNVVQLWADRWNGGSVATAAFNEKLRDHQPVRQLSSYAQKKTSGTWGVVVKAPIAVSQMIGV
jgi:hypothetical protein